jgi:DNA invertase Pin-like site-specific DNA recombinase
LLRFIISQGLPHAQAGAGFRSITENIDTTTPAGRMMMQMVGSFAEFERAIIRERTSASIAAARAEGRDPIAELR